MRMNRIIMFEQYLTGEDWWLIILRDDNKSLHLLFSIYFFNKQIKKHNYRCIIIIAFQMYHLKVK